MTPLNLSRIAKFVALFGFFLPWVLVSCSGTPVAKATGLQLAMGRMDALTSQAAQQSNASPVWWVVLALLAVIAGIVVSFLKMPDIQRARIMLGAAGAAFVLSWIGLMAVSGAVNKQVGGQTQGAFRVEAQAGFWLTILSLMAAGGMSAAVVFRREALVEGWLNRGKQTLSGLGAAAGGGGPKPGDDERYWDGLADKNDPDLLQEYLFRFPNGRFVDLARARLAAKGIEPVKPAPGGDDL